MIEKRSHESMYKTDTKKCSKEVKSDNFCYGKIRIEVEKIVILLSQYWKTCILIVH